MLHNPEQLTAILKEHEERTGVKFAYTEFGEIPNEDRYIVWWEMDVDSTDADDINYFPVSYFAIEYYTKQYRDFKGEKALERRLNKHKVRWRKNPTERVQEDVYVTVYYV